MKESSGRGGRRSRRRRFRRLQLRVFNRDEEYGATLPSLASEELGRVHGDSEVELQATAMEVLDLGKKYQREKGKRGRGREAAAEGKERDGARVGEALASAGFIGGEKVEVAVAHAMCVLLSVGGRKRQEEGGVGLQRRGRRR